MKQLFPTISLSIVHVSDRKSLSSLSGARRPLVPAPPSPWAHVTDRTCPISSVVLLSQLAIWVAGSNSELFTKKYDMEFHYLLVMGGFF